MTKILTLQTSHGEVYVESTEIEAGAIEAGGLRDKNLDKLLTVLQPFCESITNAFDSLKNLSLKPQSASAEFGLNIGGEANIFIVKASAQATIKVTINWSLVN